MSIQIHVTPYNLATVIVSYVKDQTRNRPYPDMVKNLFGTSTVQDQTELDPNRPQAPNQKSAISGYGQNPVWDGSSQGPNRTWPKPDNGRKIPYTGIYYLEVTRFATCHGWYGRFTSFCKLILGRYC